MKKDKTLNICQIADVCGACSMQGISYEQQLAIKQEKVEKLFSKYYQVNKIIQNDKTYHYRNKAQISFDYVDGKVIAGNYIESSHVVVGMKNCQLINEEVNEIFNEIVSLVKKYKVPIFDERKMKGFLRHVLIRNNYDNSEIMIVFVTGMQRYDLSNIINELLKKYPNIKTIIQNINSSYTSMILGDKNRILYGRGYIVDELCGYTFKISVSSFYQINHDQTVKLYDYALKKADIKSDDIVLDTYCGIGTIGIIASKKAKKVIGVEINKQAIKDAINNARHNDVDNISFICKDASKFMLDYDKEVDVVIMDPPRNGSDYKFISSLIRLAPDRIVYISCNPDTQLRDIKLLLKRGYQIKDIQPFDLFSFTDHIENIILLKRV